MAHRFEGVHARPLQSGGGQGPARRGGGRHQQGGRIPGRQFVGIDLRHNDRLARPERQFDGRHHRRHAHFAHHGADHGHRPFAGHQRFRAAQEVDAQLHAHVRGRHCHLDALFPAFAARERPQRAAGPHRADHFRRLHRLFRRPGRYRGPVAPRPHLDRHPRRGHRHGPDSAPLHGGLRFGYGAVPLFHRGVLPLFHQLGFHRAGDLYDRPVSQVREEGLYR